MSFPNDIATNSNGEVSWDPDSSPTSVKSIWNEQRQEQQQRKKLQLKPRSPDIGPKSSSDDVVVAVSSMTKLQLPGSGSSSGGGDRKKSDPFGGAALPREQVLLRRGIDPALQDARIERKAKVPHYTTEQNAIIEPIQQELVELETQLRLANEKELPEGDLRQKVENKRDELRKLMDNFRLINEERKTKTIHDSGTSQAVLLEYSATPGSMDTLPPPLGQPRRHQSCGGVVLAAGGTTTTATTASSPQSPRRDRRYRQRQHSYRDGKSMMASMMMASPVAPPPPPSAAAAVMNSPTNHKDASLEGNGDPFSSFVSVRRRSRGKPERY